MGYYVVHGSGSKYGPAELPVLQKWVHEGRIAKTTLVIDDKTGLTLPASSVPGLVFSGNATPPGGGQMQQPPAPNPYAAAPTYGEAYRGYPRQRVENNLVKAILATAFCCLPLGVVAIVFAAQVDGYANRGDIAMAQDYAGKADTWANWSIGLGLIGPVLYVLMMVVFGVAFH